MDAFSTLLIQISSMFFIINSGYKWNWPPIASGTSRDGCLSQLMKKPQQCLNKTPKLVMIRIYKSPRSSHLPLRMVLVLDKRGAAFQDTLVCKYLIVTWTPQARDFHTTELDPTSCFNFHTTQKYLGKKAWEVAWVTLLGVASLSSCLSKPTAKRTKELHPDSSLIPQPYHFCPFVYILTLSHELVLSLAQIGCTIDLSLKSYLV
jgi:hypothetical protein